MSRIKQIRIIENAIQSIAIITKSQCSLSEKDLSVLNDASERLEILKRKKGKTNEQIKNEIAQIVELLIQIFVYNQVNTPSMRKNPNTP